MDPYLNEDAVFERLESLRRELENSRLMAHSLRRWGTILVHGLRRRLTAIRRAASRPRLARRPVLRPRRALRG